MGPFQHTCLSRGHCNDWELEEGQGTVHASVRDPTQAPGRHPHTHRNCKAGESRSSSWDHPASRASHSLPAVTKWLTQSQLAELHEGAQTILQQPFVPSSTSRGDTHVEDRGKARHLSPQLAHVKSKEYIKYKQDADMTVPGTLRTFLLMPRGLKNSAAPAAAHSQSPWPEHCTAWSPAGPVSPDRAEQRQGHSPHHPQLWGEWLPSHSL